MQIRFSIFFKAQLIQILIASGMWEHKKKGEQNYSGGIFQEYAETSSAMNCSNGSAETFDPNSTLDLSIEKSSSTPDEDNEPDWPYPPSTSKKNPPHVGTESNGKKTPSRSNQVLKRPPTLNQGLEPTKKKNLFSAIQDDPLASSECEAELNDKQSFEERYGQSELLFGIQSSTLGRYANSPSPSSYQKKARRSFSESHKKVSSQNSNKIKIYIDRTFPDLCSLKSEVLSDIKGTIELRKVRTKQDLSIAELRSSDGLRAESENFYRCFLYCTNLKNSFRTNTYLKKHLPTFDDRVKRYLQANPLFGAKETKTEAITNVDMTLLVFKASRAESVQFLSDLKFEKLVLDFFKTGNYKRQATFVESIQSFISNNIEDAQGRDLFFSILEGIELSAYFDLKYSGVSNEKEQIECMGSYGVLDVGYETIFFDVEESGRGFGRELRLKKLNIAFKNTGVYKHSYNHVLFSILSWKSLRVSAEIESL